MPQHLGVTHNVTSNILVLRQQLMSYLQRVAHSGVQALHDALFVGDVLTPSCMCCFEKKSKKTSASYVRSAGLGFLHKLAQVSKRSYLATVHLLV